MTDVVPVLVGDLCREQRADRLVGVKPGQIGAKEHPIRASPAHKLFQDAAVVKDGGQLEVEVFERTGQVHGGVPLAMAGVAEQELDPRVASRDLAYHLGSIEFAPAPGVGQDQQLALVRILPGQAVAVAEEATTNAYKMSSAEWRGRRYDVKTLAELKPNEIVHGPFAQIIRYVGRKTDTSLSSSQYDFYKICLQDHTILSTLTKAPKLRLYPFTLYIVTHELIHVIRFMKFLQAFEASDEEKMLEEVRVHEKTKAILKPARVPGMDTVFDFYRAWQAPLDELKDMP